MSKLDNEELNSGIKRFCNSKFINNAKNIINKIDVDKADRIVNNISRINNFLKINKNKYEFRDNIKNKIRDKILQLYSDKIENQLGDFIKKHVDKLINKI